MKKPECLRFHIWQRLREYIDRHYDFRAADMKDGDRLSQPKRSQWIITNIFFRPTDIVVHYLDPGAVRIRGAMTGGAEYIEYGDSTELLALKDMADYLVKINEGPPAGTPLFDAGD